MVDSKNKLTKYESIRNILKIDFRIVSNLYTEFTNHRCVQRGFYT